MTAPRSSGIAVAGPPRRPLSTLLGIAVLTLVLVGVVAAVASAELARSEARRDAQESASRLSDLVVGPLLSRSLAGDVRADDDLRRTVHLRMSDGSISRIVVWTPDGTVVYATDPGLLGQRRPEQAAPAAVSRPSSEIATSDAFGTLPADRQYVQVRVPLRAVPGLVQETSYDAHGVARRSADLALPLLGIAVVPLVLLQALQAPFVVSLVRRVRRGARERSQLLERALSASDRERREIAAGLHDTVVQDLTAAGYVLDAAGRRLPLEWRDLTGDAVAAVQGSVDALRGLLVDLYPPDLTGTGLGAALETLAVSLREQGVRVEVGIDPAARLDDDLAGALYRIARECLVNVEKHAGATEVRVRLEPCRGGVRLRVDDDGVGVPADLLDRGRPGHLGLALVRDRVADLGGTYRLGPGPGGGTAVLVELPLPVS